MIGVWRASPSQRADLAPSPRSRRAPASGSPSAPRRRARAAAPRRPRAVGDDLDAVAALAQHVERDRLVGRVVLGEQDRRAVALGRAAAARWASRGGRRSPDSVLAIVSYRRDSRTGLVSVALMPGPPRERPAELSRITRGPSPASARGDVEAVHPRHVVVEQDQVVRLAAFAAPPRRSAGPSSPPSARAGVHPPGRQPAPRISRLVALSSTISTRRPASSRGARTPAAARRRHAGP